jgi:hypothetical protein
MNGFITRGLTTACFAGVLAFAGGCEIYHNLVDPCYPQRYEYMSRQEANAAMAPQVFNGRVLDQTVWNTQFEPGTDKLNAAGMEHLSYLARRRPMPDSVVYLQTAQDIAFDTSESTSDKFAMLRTDLDNHRVQAIQKYLKGITAGRQLSFEVVVHDPSAVGLPAAPLGGDGRYPGAVQKMYLGFQGNLAPLGTGASGGAQGAGVGAAPSGAPR